MENLIHGENEWDGEVGVLRLWGPVVSFLKKMLH